MFRKGQKSLEMIIGLVILLVVAGVVISTFLSQFQDNPGNQYDSTLEAEEITRECTSMCANYKGATGIKAQTAAIDYCTSNFVLDENGDGTIAGTAGVGYNRYCEDGVKCFHKHTCEVGSTTLNAERCAEIMYNYYTSSQIDESPGEANESINDLYDPDNNPQETDETIGTCGISGLNPNEDPTWWSENFNRP
jgi:hypothetical protein